MRNLLLLVTACLTACGGGSPTSRSDTETDFPTIAEPCAGGPGSAIYMVIGFGGNVPDPSAAPPLEARMRVGETVVVGLQLSGCGIHNRESWTSTNTAAAVVAPMANSLPPGFQVVPTNPQAAVTAVAPGQFTVFVDFTGPDDKVHRTTLAYCPGLQYPGFPSAAGGCPNPRKIAIVTVAP